jgi:D-sedoheptulose 7-phosphate isomerase
MVIAGVDERAVEELYRGILHTFESHRTLWLFGCGGSASNAEHIASEFVSHWTGIKLPALALTTNPAVLTAIANDYGFENIFWRQLEALAQRGDLVIGLSTAGTAEAVTKGIEWAVKNGITTSAWTGSKGLKFSRLSDFPIVVDKEWTGTIQERHLELGHLLSDMVGKYFLDRVKE